MKNFVILFQGAEGTSAIVRYLNNFQEINIIHQDNGKGWEPFDEHNSGKIHLRDFLKCINLIFGRRPFNPDVLNGVYKKKSMFNLVNFSNDLGVVGFKMRYRSKDSIFRTLGFERLNSFLFHRFFMRYLKKHGVVVFVMFRCDRLRWALSKYHGDGTGKKGHLQFKVADGDVKKDEIGKVHVDINRLKEILKKCERVHEGKRNLMRAFKSEGIETHSLIYEDFLRDKSSFFASIFQYLDLEISYENLQCGLKKGGHFSKVHNDDLSSFVENHEEVINSVSHDLINH